MIEPFKLGALHLPIRGSGKALDDNILSRALVSSERLRGEFA
jgi:hypothetical protein